MRKSTLLLGFCTLLGGGLGAQVISYTPAYPTLQDSVEITFNAALGNGALAGVSPVYMHTGVISRNSLSDSDWRHRINPWPTGDPDLVIVDSIVRMQSLGNNLHRIKIKPSTYYGTNQLSRYVALAFVFRNLTGTLAGKTADEKDIYIPIFRQGFDALFFRPMTTAYRVAENAPIDIQILANASANITLFHDGVQVHQVSGATALNHTLNAQAGMHWLRLEAVSGANTVVDSMYYIVEPPQTVQNPPFASQNGINYVNDTTVLLQLYAPGKSFAHVIGDFNNWQIRPEYRMKRTVDGTAFWLELTGLTPGQEYRFQYVVDQDVVIADPWADKYLDEFNDIAILPFTYPGLIGYPTGKTNHMVSIFQTGQQPFQWQTTGYTRPWSQDLVIYEMLIRDFVQRHDYATILDTLDYLQRLGINAIELMPINEFDGNLSWGYSPAFYFAPDKYYGPKNDLKRLIDECHRRGIAVILDVVFNHAFGQNTMARLYMDKNSGKPSNDNPWFNSYIPHPYGYHNDFNHSKGETQYFVDRCLYYWLTEYKVDGFRFDLSKGFTQVYSYPSDMGLWSAYDPDRVYWLKRIFNQVRSYDPDCYMILEHFANGDEEQELSNHGFFLWGNAQPNYKQAALGYTNGSDFKWAVSSKHRGWTYQHLIGYMESHDEERLMYECKEYGNMRIVGGDTLYNIRDVNTALKRMELCAAFFYTVPGPKMLWQFGELGYDFSINFNGRTGPKPLRWNYLENPNRLRLYKAMAAMIKLKTQNVAFRSADYDLDTWGNGKRMWVSSPSMNVTVIGNFGIDSLNGMMPGFQHTGQWYDYMTGDTIQVNDVNAPIPLGPGDYHIYTDVKLAEPDLSVGVQEILANGAPGNLNAQAYPNPFDTELRLDFELPASSKATVRIYTADGTLAETLHRGFLPAGKHSIAWQPTTALPDGIYFYSIEQGKYRATSTVVKAAR